MTFLHVVDADQDLLKDRREGKCRAVAGSRDRVSGFSPVCMQNTDERHFSYSKGFGDVYKE